MCIKEFDDNKLICSFVQSQAYCIVLGKNDITV